MSRHREDVRERPQAKAFDVPNAAAALVPFGAAGPMMQPQAAAPALDPSFATPVSRTDASLNRPADDAAHNGASGARWWIGAGVRLARNALLAVAVMALVPIALTIVAGPTLSRMLYSPMRTVETRRQAAELLRVYALPKDPTITTARATRAFSLLHAPRVHSAGFEPADPGPRPAVPWRTLPMAPDMFPTARPDMYTGPSSRTILEAAAAGFNEKETTYLRALSTTQLWREFDVLARAPAVDLVSAQFKTPFGADARPEARPLIPFSASKELAYASVSRAAYHLSLGQRDSAEAALRGIVSFGFMFVDNGTNATDELIGGVIVGIGRDALQRFYVITHDARAGDAALVQQKIEMSPNPQAALTADARERWLARVESPVIPRAERFGALRVLSATSCTNPRELLFGPRSDVTDLLARARRTLARFPSEQALIDLETQSPQAPTSYRWNAPVSSLAVSMASVAGVVLHNPRLAQCTVLLTPNF